MPLTTHPQNLRLALAVILALCIAGTSAADPKGRARWQREKSRATSRHEVIGRNETIVGVTLPAPWDIKPPGPEAPDFATAQEAAWAIIGAALDAVVTSSRFSSNYIKPNSVESFESVPHMFRLYGLAPQAIPYLSKSPGISFVSNDAKVATISAPLRTGTGVFLHPTQIGLENGGSIPYTDVDGLQHSSIKDVDIDILDAWQASVGEPTIVVAIIDDTIDTSTPEISTNVFTNTKEKPCNDIDDDKNGFIDDYQGYDATRKTGCSPDDLRRSWGWSTPRMKSSGPRSHGTGMALTIASLPTRMAQNDKTGTAPITGVAPGIQYLPISTGSSIDEGLYHAYAYIIALKRSGVPIRVVNLSLGARHTDAWSCSPMTRDGNSLTVLGELLASGVTIVTAAGNDGSNNDRSFMCPSGLARDYDSVISVGAVDPEGKLPFWSNFGSLSVTTSAPGTVIHNGYNFQTGTSPATALVSGTAALMYSVNPALSPKELKEMIIDSTKMTELNLPTKTRGVLSAGKAVRAAQQRRGPAMRKRRL